MDETVVQPTQNSTNPRSVLLQIFSLLIIVFIFLGALNYFNLLPISKTFPFLSFLPHTPSTSKGLSSCKVVPEKFCSQGEWLSWTDANGAKWDLIGFNLPKDTRIYAPIKGSLSKGEGGIFKGITAGLKDRENPTSVAFTFIGALVFDNMSAVNNIKPEDEITRIGDRGITNFGNYNFAVTAKQKGVTPSILKELFPTAFGKPAKQVK